MWRSLRELHAVARAGPLSRPTFCPVWRTRSRIAGHFEGTAHRSFHGHTDRRPRPTGLRASDNSQIFKMTQGPLSLSVKRSMSSLRSPKIVGSSSFDEVVALVASQPKPLLVAIDGLPLSGKTTLAQQVTEELGAECLGLDDFVRPEAEWSSRDKPSFPFDFVRYGEFVDAVCSLAHNRRCWFHHTIGRQGVLKTCQRWCEEMASRLLKASRRCIPTWRRSTIFASGSRVMRKQPWPRRCKEVLDRGLTNGSSCSYPASNSTSRPILRAWPGMR
jgi:hypothetical protein